MDFLLNKAVLEEWYKESVENFEIDKDPISIPKRFSNLQDIEIMGFFAAILAWGNRKSILNSCNKLIQIFENAPFLAIQNLDKSMLIQLEKFTHRTFQPIDAAFFVQRFHDHYKTFPSLESAFKLQETTNGNHLSAFHTYWFSVDYAVQRTRKHIANPVNGGNAKRINMFLRWMCRPNDGIDFGLWHSISPASLFCPLDVHIARISRQYGLLTRKQDDWKSVVELTNALQTFDSNDPIKYDLALFHKSVSLI